jgi:hypothetical protein
MLWIYNLPNWALCTLILGVIVGGTLLGQILSRKLVRRSFSQALDDHNEAVGAFIQAYGVFYGITLGLVAVAAWNNYDKCNDIVENEAAALSAFARDVSVLPQKVRGELQTQIVEYLDHLIDEAWKEHRHGKNPSLGGAKIQAIHQRLAQFTPSTERESILFKEALDQLNQWVERRSTRLSNLTTGLPSVLWGILIAGAAINTLILYVIRVEPFHAHLALTGLVACFIGLMIFLIAAMDHPFQGDLSIDSQPFELLRSSLKLTWNR